MKKVLIIGSGGIGRRHLRGYLATGRATLSIVEPDLERRAETEATFDLEASHEDLSEADLSTFDLAVICAPAHLHLPLMLACAAEKLPFMVEKPLAVAMGGVDAALRAVNEAGIIARVGYIRRIAPEVLALRQRIEAGDIGSLKLVYMNSSQEFPKYRPDFQRTYYARPDMGGGAILDAASHSFDMLIWLMGRPAQVSAMYDRLVLEGTETEDTCLISIRFESGAMANLTINQFQKPNTNRNEFIGTKGNLTLEHSVLSHWRDDSGNPAESQDYMDGLVPTEAHQARFTIQANAMLDAIEGGPCHLATLEDARVNLQIALAAKQSWLDQKIITISK